MAPSRDLLLSSHPLKEQPAQLSYCCLWSPLANYCLAGARAEPGRKGDSWQHRSSPATSMCRGTSASPAQTFWQGHGWSPRTCRVEISVKVARRGLHNHLPLLCKCPHRPRFGHEAGEGQMSAAQRDPGGRMLFIAKQCCSHPEQCVSVMHCWRITLPQHQLGSAALTSPPRHGKQGVGFVSVERACQALTLQGSAVCRWGCSEEVWMSRVFAHCQHRNNLSLRWERQKMTSSFHCNLAAPKGFNMILQAELCCCNLFEGHRSQFYRGREQS